MPETTPQQDQSAGLPAPPEAQVDQQIDPYGLAHGAPAPSLAYYSSSPVASASAGSEKADDSSGPYVKNTWRSVYGNRSRTRRTSVVVTFSISSISSSMVRRRSSATQVYARSCMRLNADSPSSTV